MHSRAAFLSMDVEVVDAWPTSDRRGAGMTIRDPGSKRTMIVTIPEEQFEAWGEKIGKRVTWALLDLNEPVTE